MMVGLQYFMSKKKKKHFTVLYFGQVLYGLAVCSLNLLNG